MSPRLRTAARWIAVSLLATLAVGLYALAFVDLPRLIERQQAAERIGAQSPDELRFLLRDCETQRRRRCLIVAVPVPKFNERAACAAADARCYR